MEEQELLNESDDKTDLSIHIEIFTLPRDALVGHFNDEVGFGGRKVIQVCQDCFFRDVRVTQRSGRVQGTPNKGELQFVLAVWVLENCLRQVSADCSEAHY